MDEPQLVLQDREITFYFVNKLAANDNRLVEFDPDVQPTYLGAVHILDHLLTSADCDRLSEGHWSISVKVHYTHG